MLVYLKDICLRLWWIWKSDKITGILKMWEKEADEAIAYYVAKYDMRDFLNENLINALRYFRFPSHSTILSEQDDFRYLHFLVSGEIQISHYHLSGNMVVFAIHQPFVTLGDLELFCERRIRSNAIAIKNTLMLGLSNEAVELYGADDARFLRFILKQLQQKLFTIAELQENQMLPIVNQLAAYILSMSSTSKNDIAELPSKEVLASILRTTPRHLNRVLKHLAEIGAISSDYPQLRVLDRIYLVKLIS